VVALVSMSLREVATIAFLDFLDFLTDAAFAPAACLALYFSTRPMVSTKRISPVKKGWH